MIEIRKCKFGRGIFATRDIKKDEVVERSPVIVISPESHVHGTILETYVFQWTDRRKDCAVALGLGSIFNHSWNQNVSYRPDHKKLEIVYKAVRNIPKGEQLFINYGYTPLTKKQIQKRLRKA